METEAGPQMDLAVAKAVGFDARTMHDFARGAIVHIPTGRSLAGQSIMREFRPSVDANDAFEAAEKCIVKSGVDVQGRSWVYNLFESFVLSQCDDTWSIYDNSHGGSADSFADGPTPSVAICRAILKLSS